MRFVDTHQESYHSVAKFNTQIISKKHRLHDNVNTYCELCHLKTKNFTIILFDYEKEYGYLVINKHTKELISKISNISNLSETFRSKIITSSDTNIWKAWNEFLELKNSISKNLSLITEHEIALKRHASFITSRIS